MKEERSTFLSEDYLEDYEGQHLDWKWRGPSSVTFVPIPASAVFH